jgi:hypothetical protein
MEGRIPLLERDLQRSFEKGRRLRPSIANEDVECAKLGSDPED